MKPCFSGYTPSIDDFFHRALLTDWGLFTDRRVLLLMRGSDHTSFTPLVSLVAGLVAFFIKTLILDPLANAVTKAWLARRLEIEMGSVDYGKLCCIVRNKGPTCILGASVSLTISFDPSDVKPGKAFIVPGHIARVKKSLACWSRMPAGSQAWPTTLDISPGQEVVFALAEIRRDRIVFPSEEGWWPDSRARIILKRRQYCGIVTVTSHSTNACDYSFTLDADGMPPLCFGSQEARSVGWLPTCRQRWLHIKALAQRGVHFWAPEKSDPEATGQVSESS